MRDRCRHGLAFALRAGNGKTGTPPAPDNDAVPRGFVQKVTKSIRDFGLGRKALLEGGVGMFVFAGIGAHGPAFEFGALYAIG